jgi:hypothetical protein
LWARLAHEGRQRLAAPKVGAAQQKQIIETTLVLLGFLLLIGLKLVEAKGVHYFTLPPRLLEIFTAGVSKSFCLNQLFLQGMLPFGQNGTAENVKLQFRRAYSGF